MAVFERARTRPHRKEPGRRGHSFLPAERVAAVAVAVLALFARTAAAQRDTLTPPVLGPIIVTAERTPLALGSSTSSVSRISAADLARTPHATLADVLRRVPGFTVIDFDGLGFDPQLMVRGFYGGGEAEYVVLLVDGKPVAQLQTGLIPWDVLPPLSAIESIEIVRGSTSALYGDAAIGGVINVITRNASASNPIRWDLSGGAYGSGTVSGAGGTDVAGHAVSGAAGYDRTDGARAHAARDAARLQASANLLTSATANLAFSVRSYDHSFDEPGPLLGSLLAADRSASDPLYRFDHTNDQSTALALTGDRTLGRRSRLSASVTSEWRHTDAIRTLALAPDFGDTRERNARNVLAAGTAQLDVSDGPLPGVDHVILGIEAARGSLDSRYFDVVTGDGAAHLAGDGARGPLDASSTTTRVSGALYGQYAVQVVDPVRLSIGARFDWLSDEFNTPSAAALSATHEAFSPKVGLSVRYAHSAQSTGNIYVTASGSFKAPTLDQLFDQRPIPVPFPPYTVTTSNAQLNPQRGGNIEAGVYHTAAISSAWHASASLSVYQMEMHDEVDFDLQSLRYVNIGKSRHRGVEAGIVLTAFRTTSLFANYTLQAATSRSGDNAGKYLKAIPRHTMSGGATFTPWSALETGVIVTSTRGAYLDDANTLGIPGFTRVDARASWAFATVSMFTDIRNVLNARYNDSGFLDPSGSGAAYYYPAAGRVVSVGLRRGW